MKPDHINLQTEGKLLATVAAYKTGLISGEDGPARLEAFWTAFMDGLKEYTRDKIVLSGTLPPE